MSCYGLLFLTKTTFAVAALVGGIVASAVTANYFCNSSGDTGVVLLW